MMDITSLWNTLLSLGGALILWNMKQHLSEQKRIEILLNRTREEMAREYVTKSEVDKLTTHIDARFNKLDEKLDRVLNRVTV
jgi:histidinol phosphatase-like enzyme